MFDTSLVKDLTEMFGKSLTFKDIDAVGGYIFKDHSFSIHAIAGVDKGLWLETNRAWSIDDLRSNFQFTTEFAREINGGKTGDVVKNATYTAITTDFWNKCDAIAGPEEWKMWGTPNCGKGQPGQTAHVGHGTSPARFREIEIIG